MKDVFRNTIVFAERDMVVRNQELLRKLLVAIGTEMCKHYDGNPEEWANNCWVSDVSDMTDFNLEAEEIARISAAVNVPIGEDDLIYAILARMGGAQ